MGLLNDFSPGGSTVNLSADSIYAAPVAVMAAGSGNVKVDTLEGDTLTVPVQAGQTLPWSIRKIYSTANGTTVTQGNLFTVRLP
jgi:hypothetical protein